MFQLKRDKFLLGALLGALVVLVGCAERVGNPEMSFTASPELRAGDLDGAGQIVVSGFETRARLLVNGDKSQWVTFHALSTRATQSLGEAIQPFMSLIETGSAAEVLVPVDIRPGRPTVLHAVLLVDEHTVESHAASLSAVHRVSPTLNLGIDLGMLNEDRSLLGLVGLGSLDFPESETRYVRAWLRRTLPGGASVFLVATSGSTDAGELQGAIKGTFTATESNSAAIGIEASGVVHPTDHVSMTVSSPLRVQSGDITISAPGEVTDEGEIRTIDSTGSLAPTGRELRLQAEYARPLSARSAMSWQAWIQSEPAHDATASTNVGVGFTYSLRFNSGAWRVALEERRVGRTTADDD